MSSASSQDSLSELVKIGNHLYKMIFAIYQSQFQTNISPSISDEEAKLSELLLEEHYDLNTLNKNIQPSTILQTSNSFTTFCPNESSSTPPYQATNQKDNPFFICSFEDDESFESDLSMSKRKNQKNEKNGDELQQLFYPQKLIIKEEMKFFCKFCRFSTKTKQHLGGHISKNHPGKGENSKKKSKAKRKRDYNNVMHYSIVQGM